MNEKLETPSVQSDLPEENQAEDTKSVNADEIRASGSKWKHIRAQEPHTPDSPLASKNSKSSGEETNIDEESHQSLQALNTQLKEENQELKQKLQYSEAELQNAARRHREVLERTRQYAGTSAIEAFFPLLDSLEVANETTGGQNEKTEEKGRQHILDLMYTIFKKLSVIPIDPLVAESFDPNLHSAVAAEPADDSSQEANTIIKVIRKGYRLHERVIRPAMVVISAARES